MGGRGVGRLNAPSSLGFCSRKIDALLLLRIARKIHLQLTRRTLQMMRS